MTYQQPPIADYGFLSDCQSAVLVSSHGSIDWWCVPRFDSPSVLGRLLDAEAGSWQIRPEADFTIEREYVGDSLVLRTVMRTAAGEVVVTDALALGPGERGHDIGRRSPHVLLRRVEGRAGRVRMRSDLTPRFEYGRTEPHLQHVPGGVEARGGPVRLLMSTAVETTCSGGTISAEFEVAADESVEFALAYSPAFPLGSGVRPGGQTATGSDAAASIEDTVTAWHSWAAPHPAFDGRYAAQVRRSSLVLQGLTYAPSGAVVAAATTSLPEQLGGELNFDYRYPWLRDLSLTVRSLWIAACPEEPRAILDWFATSAGQIGDELIQIMYGVEGERDLTEHTLEHLSGYRGSRPVRIGNAAWSQVQLDVLGEVLDAAALLRDSIGTFTGPVRDMLVTLADRAAAQWSSPDAGMWEARDAQRQYTSSKVMCWVALDRAVDLADHLGPGADPHRWAAAREKVREAILVGAWSEATGAYAGAFGSDELDASVLVLPLVGFLPARDERMWATIEAIEDRLGERGLVRRWADDTGGFLLCTYWLAGCLAMGGELGRARSWFERATGHANDLGLLSEEADTDTGEMLGNVPQAFSHVGLINAAWRIREAERAAEQGDSNG